MGGQLLTVRAVSAPSATADAKWFTAERPHGQFMWPLGLASGFDSDSVTASCDRGVLRVVMPIEQPAVRKIPLKQPAS